MGALQRVLDGCQLVAMQLLKVGIHYTTFKMWTDFKTPGIIYLPTLEIVTEEKLAITH